MTETEWGECADPELMLRLLSSKGWGVRGTRKFRLFACACLRWLDADPCWQKLSPQLRKVVEVAEKYADDLATNRQLGQARRAAKAAEYVGTGRFKHAAEYAVDNVPFQAAFWTAQFVAKGYAELGYEYEEEPALADAQYNLAGLLRDIFGVLPFRSVNIAPACLTSDVVSVALTVYEERHLPSGHLDSARLSVLADAIEEAGCTDRAILDHLRSAGPHTRGCWPVDLLLAKG